MSISCELFALHHPFATYTHGSHFSCIFVFPSALGSQLENSGCYTIAALRRSVSNFAIRRTALDATPTPRLAASDAARHTTFHRYTVGER